VGRDAGDDVPARRTQAQRSAEARERLLQAAAALIAEGGLGALTVAEVGRRAGYSRGIAHYHFGSKDALVAELVGQVERVHGYPTARHRTSAVERSQTTAVFIGMLRRLRRSTRRSRAVVRAVVSPPRPEPAGGLGRAWRTITRIVVAGRAAGDVRADVDSRAFAVGLLGSCAASRCSTCWIGVAPGEGQHHDRALDP
jgi:AcrR family transcriptional regulator